MCIVTWSVSGRDFEVDAFLERFPELKIDGSWHRGDKGPLKRVAENSGFSVLLFEGKDAKGAVQATRRALEALERVRGALADSSVQSRLRFGLYVGDKDSFVPSLSFDAEDLQFFSRAGVAIEVLGYPVSEDD